MGAAEHIDPTITDRQIRLLMAEAGQLLLLPEIRPLAEKLRRSLLGLSQDHVDDVLALTLLAAACGAAASTHRWREALALQQRVLGLVYEDHHQTQHRTLH